MSTLRITYYLYVQRFEWETSSTVLSIQKPGWWSCLGRFRCMASLEEMHYRGWTLEVNATHHVHFTLSASCLHLKTRPCFLLLFCACHWLPCFPATMNSYSSGTIRFFCMLHVALITVFYHSKGKMTNTTCMARTKLAKWITPMLFIFRVLRQFCQARLTKAPHTVHKHTQTSAGTELVLDMVTEMLKDNTLTYLYTEYAQRRKKPQFISETESSFCRPVWPWT